VTTEAVTTADREQAYRDDSHQLLFVVDHAGRLLDVDAGGRELLGWEAARRGAPLMDAVHPEDQPRLMQVLDESAAHRRPAVLVMRVRGADGQWARVRSQLSPLTDHNPPRYAMAISVIAPEAEASDDRAARYERHLWRIALEVQTARIGDRTSRQESWWTDPALAGLSERQGEILRRVAQGDEVAAIARELVISESTVRNHLSGIYQKFGVHSRAALVSRLMRGDGGVGGQRQR
jgi:PAS domain S-box-containing protein